MEKGKKTDYRILYCYQYNNNNTWIPYILYLKVCILNENLFLDILFLASLNAHPRRWYITRTEGLVK
jgi:hypothetical protein